MNRKFGCRLDSSAALFVYLAWREEGGGGGVGQEEGPEDSVMMMES